MYRNSRHLNYLNMLKLWPNAAAVVTGSKDYPSIGGIVRFYQTKEGVLVAAEIAGLPLSTGECSSPIFGFHIHAGESCSGNENDPFANTLTHYNIYDCPHPFHAGDLPPLFGVNGYAFSVFLTDRFSVNEVVDKTIVIHSKADDFTTQPAGNSGVKIACGEIKKMKAAW